MGADLEQKMNRRWYGGEPVPAWQRALVPLYRLGQRIDRAWKSARRPGDLESARIVVVGNLTAGGSGKTPLVIWLAAHLRQQGWHPGIVSRGYGGRARQWPQQVRADSDPAAVGDEAVMLAATTGCPMSVGPDRSAAVEALLQHTDIDIIISDDGLQHYALARDLEIVVIDGERRLGNGLLLPAGPFTQLHLYGHRRTVTIDGQPHHLPRCSPGHKIADQVVEATHLHVIDGGDDVAREDAVEHPGSQQGAQAGPVCLRHALRASDRRAAEQQARRRAVASPAAGVPTTMGNSMTWRPPSAKSRVTIRPARWPG